MAGDWIKMRIDLQDDPAVVAISDRLEMDEFSVIGRLHRLWGWADKHTVDGNAANVTPKWVDKYVQQSGFAEAMISAGWLVFENGILSFPKFDIHNGKSAKSRCEAALRQRQSRSCHTNVTEKCDKVVTKAQPEKRREEKTHTVSSLPSSPHTQNTEPPFPLLSCNRSEWAEIGECAIPPSLSVFQNEVFAWVRHLRSMRGPNFDPNELQLHLRDAVKLGRRFPGSCEWSIKTRKERLAQTKHEPDEKIDFDMWHKVKLAFDAGGNNPTAIREQLGETAFEAWVKLARTTLKEKIDDQESRRSFAAEFVGNTGTELAGKYFQCLKEVCSE